MANPKPTTPALDIILEKQNLISEKWKPVNDKIYQIVSANEEETLPYYQIALQLMKNLNQATENNEDPFPDANAKKFFHSEFVPNLCKYLLLNRAYRLPECSKIHDAILVECVRFVNNHILKEDNIKLVDTMRHIFDLQKIYYKMNNQDENQNMPVLFLIFFLLSFILNFLIFKSFLYCFYFINIVFLTFVLFYFLFFKKKKQNKNNFIIK